MKKKVLASLGLAMAMVATTMPAMAAEEVDGGHELSTHYGSVTKAEVCKEQTIKEDEQATCDVYAEVGSEFTVTIPKALTLSGTDKNGTYKVSVEGDIAGNQYVSVTPDKTFAMKQTGKKDVTATITQAVNKFRGDNYTSELLSDGSEVKFATGATGSISAADLSAGRWNGTFNFTIALNTDSAE